LYEAYWGDWEVLTLRFIATPVYEILLAAFIWALIGPVIFLKSQLRKRRVRLVLEVNGVDLKNPGVVAITRRVNMLGTNSIDPMMQSIDNLMRNQQLRNAGDGHTISDEVIAKMISQQILVRNDIGQLDLNPNRFEKIDDQIITIRESYGDLVIIDDQESMTARGVLVNEHGEVRVNDEAAHALTVLAKYYGKHIPDTLLEKNADTTVRG
jgi:hypothetical protein